MRRGTRHRSSHAHRMQVCVLVSLVPLLLPTTSDAQFAPTGTHYAGRPSDTGHDGPSSSGGYASSIPLDLPPARGGLPLPLQVASGTRGFGAAGLGWDVPLSFLHVDRSYAHRRPANSPGNCAARQQCAVS